MELPPLRYSQHTITNSGLIKGDIYFSSGASNDIIKNTGTITGYIDMGDGDDKFMGGAQGELVTDRAGQDTYNLGAGDDYFYAFGADHNVGVDTVDGGSNAKVDFSIGQFGDTYVTGSVSNVMATGSVLINLNSKANMMSSTPSRSPPTLGD
ncbi:MAG: hypothetical protein U1E15_06330 [Hyphomicrobiales bacterium]